MNLPQLSNFSDAQLKNSMNSYKERMNQDPQNSEFCLFNSIQSSNVDFQTLLQLPSHMNSTIMLQFLQYLSLVSPTIQQEQWRFLVLEATSLRGTQKTIINGLVVPQQYYNMPNRLSGPSDNLIFCFLMVEGRWVIIIIDRLQGKGRIVDFNGQNRENLLKAGTAIRIVLKEQYQITPETLRWTTSISDPDKENTDNWTQPVNFTVEFFQKYRGNQEAPVELLKKKDKIALNNMIVWLFLELKRTQVQKTLKKPRQLHRIKIRRNQSENFENQPKFLEQGAVKPFLDGKVMNDFFSPNHGQRKTNEKEQRMQQQIANFRDYKSTPDNLSNVNSHKLLPPINPSKGNHSEKNVLSIRNSLDSKQLQYLKELQRLNSNTEEIQSPFSSNFQYVSPAQMNLYQTPQNGGPDYNLREINIFTNKQMNMIHPMISSQKLRAKNPLDFIDIQCQKNLLSFNKRQDVDQMRFKIGQKMHTQA